MPDQLVIEPRRLCGQQDLEIEVNGPDGANRLFIYSGIAELEVSGGEPHPKWQQAILSFDIGRCFDDKTERVLKTIATASLAGIRNDGVASFAGWRVYGAAADWDEETCKVRLNIAVGARDSQGYIEQVAYQVHVMAHIS